MHTEVREERSMRVYKWEWSDMNDSQILTSGSLCPPFSRDALLEVFSCNDIVTWGAPNG
jgi:hypothetical protein